MKRSMKVIGTYCFGLVLVVTLLSGILFEAIAADTVKIGLIEVKSGPFESVGRFFRGGFYFAVDEQNAKGGLFGKKIEVISEDDEFKADIAVRKAKKLILEDKVNIICSGTTSPTAVALNKLAADYKVINIIHSGRSDEVQGSGFTRYGFRVVQNMYSHFAALAPFMANKPYRRFYIIGPDYLASYSMAAAFKEQIKIYVPEGKVAGEDYFPLGATKDFGPYVTKIIGAKADAVITCSFGPDFVHLVKQARAMGLKAPFPFFSNILEPYPMYEFKEDAVGLHFTHAYSLRVNTPENQEMIRRYHEKHKNDKDFQTWWPVGDLATTILGWKMTFAAIEKAGSLDPERIIETFEGFQYNTPVGLWTMRKCDHQVIVPMYGMVMESQNPYFDGSIRQDVKFPWEGPNIQTIPAEKANIPATPNYNPRCQ